jgi:hypothetical protein
MERMFMQHPVERPIEAKPIVIEVSGEPLGVVIPAGDGYRFLAVKLPVFAIDGKVFASIEAARLAAGAAAAGS